MEFVLVIAAIIPVVILCFYIYIKDNHKESLGLLAKLFFRGMLTVIPIVATEMLAQLFFSTEKAGSNYVLLFINVFISVGIIEEFFKWSVTRKVGYNDREFDEIYDIIVYSVFVSLGFAVVENILYVLQNGMGNAIMRALTSIPGHTCFAISMGAYLAKAKIASLNNNKRLYKKNVFLSLLVPTLLHTTYDFFAFAGIVYGFYGFHILMVIFCFINANKLSKLQVNFSRNVSSGKVINNMGSIEYRPSVSNTSNETPSTISFCPVCGFKYRGGNYCGACGFKLK